MITELNYGKQIVGEPMHFTQLECGGCGIPFYVPTKWFNNKTQSHGEFHCPNGCNRQFCAKTEAQKLREKLEKVQAEKDKQEQELQNKWLDVLGEKIQLEKKLKRIHKGVCPCCNRSFQNLKRHMEKKHPEIKDK